MKPHLARWKMDREEGESVDSLAMFGFCNKTDLGNQVFGASEGQRIKRFTDQNYPLKPCV